jgi:EAL domain-containing protein (putative c-di-GMP-specific phosphodiesterase class I)/GGDEF domain-containing protein
MIAAHPKTPLLKALIDQRAIRAVFQPIVDLNDGMIVAHEALCRPLPDSGFANADDLFHSADEAGLLWELEQVTRALALEAAADWPRDTRLFLNTSPSVFADDRFARVLREDLARIPHLGPNQIVLEVTERSEIAFDDTLLRQVNLAKDVGFNVAIDDAGAGTSGLNRMMQIRPHWIKLDRQLVSEIDADPYKQNLVRFFVHFARMSGVSVIAEGIENPAELATLMGLGIRFGQGYFLARPADRAATMDHACAAGVRERWASVEAGLPAEPHSLPMVRLCTGVLVIEASLTSIADVAAQLGKNPEHSGAVITEGRRLIGWADRRSIMRASLDTGANNPVTSITRPAVCALAPDATVQEALQFACTREDDDLSQPIIIAAGAEIVGVVHMRELLRAAACDIRPGSRQGSPVSDLPARVRADQHLELMIARGQDSALRLSRDYHPDAAFIDVRRFADYNTLFGYEMGDRLIRTLSDQINATIAKGSSDGIFLAHLGDDRFLITARTGLLEPRLRLLLQNFEHTSAALTAPSRLPDVRPSTPAAPAADASATGTATATGPNLGLRILYLPHIFDRITHPREVYRVEQQLRQKARNQERLLTGGNSLFITDERNTRGRAMRAAA